MTESRYRMLVAGCWNVEIVKLSLFLLVDIQHLASSIHDKTIQKKSLGTQ